MMRDVRKIIHLFKHCCLRYELLFTKPQVEVTLSRFKAF